MKLPNYVLAISLFVLLFQNKGLSQGIQQAGEDKPSNHSEEANTIGDGLRKVASHSYEQDIDIEVHELENDIEAAVENVLKSFELSFKEINIHPVEVDLSDLNINLDRFEVDFDFRDINIDRMEFDMENIDLNIDIDEDF